MADLTGMVPYETFPRIGVGSVGVSTFGLCVGLGLSVGAALAGRYVARRSTLGEAEVLSSAALLIVAGLVGARVSWVLSHLEEVRGPIDVVAVWRGGLQFSGGFAGAVMVGAWTFRQWSRHDRWVVIDGFALGLTVGLAFGRVGCIAVGEHLGQPSGWWLAVRYEGGPVREEFLGDVLLVPGTTFHHTAIYELLFLALLAIVLTLLVRQSMPTATLMAAFCGGYGGFRYLSDYMRANDQRLFGLTGAQYLMICLIVASFWIWIWVIPKLEMNAPTTYQEDVERDAPAPPV